MTEAFPVSHDDSPVSDQTATQKVVFAMRSPRLWIVVTLLLGLAAGAQLIGPAVIPVGAAFLKTVAPTFGFTGVMRAYSGGFRGAGKTLTAAAIAIFTQGVVRLPLAWVGAEQFGTDGLFAAFVVSNIVGGIIAFLWFRQGSWREADLTDSPRGGVSETVVEDDPAVDD